MKPGSARSKYSTWDAPRARGGHDGREDVTFVASSSPRSTSAWPSAAWQT
jgi:hypothetical protein